MNYFFRIFAIRTKKERIIFTQTKPYEKIKISSNGTDLCRIFTGQSG